MSNFENIRAQTELFKKTVKEYKKQNENFLTVLNETLKNAPEKDQGKVEEVRILTSKVFGLAKQGKVEEAQKIIKDFSNGSKGNK